jgi:SAM-dependent methyltransferase
MSTTLSPPAQRVTSYGEQRTSLVDRFGVWLSRRAIQKRLPARRDLVALDLGSGYHATLLRALLPSLAEGVAVDVKLSPELNAPPRLAGVESTVEDALPGLADGRFDLVLLINVLEHLWEPLTVLQHCRRVLRPGGVLFVNVPTWRGKFFLEFSAFRLGTSPALEMDDHKMYYDKRDLWPLLVRAGFKPSAVRLNYHKFGLNLFGSAAREK